MITALSADLGDMIGLQNDRCRLKVKLTSSLVATGFLTMFK